MKTINFFYNNTLRGNTEPLLFTDILYSSDISLECLDYFLSCDVKMMSVIFSSAARHVKPAVQSLFKYQMNKFADEFAHQRVSTLFIGRLIVSEANLPPLFFL